MTFVRFTQFVPFLLILKCISSEQPQPMFRTTDNNFDIGFCFGVDYIVVYRSTLEGDQLLGNSSDNNSLNVVPADLQGRIHITENHELLGLQIVNITHTDSGIYRRECWANQTQIRQRTFQLSVCNQEIESEEIIVEDDGGAELRCNSTSIGLEGTSVHWYYESYPNYTRTLLLDSSVSLNPLVEELPGVVEVRDQGARLVLDNNMLKNSHQFFCLVFNGTNCFSFQNIYAPDYSHSSEMYVSHGEEVFLYCPVDGHNQQWETPLGKITGSSEDSQQMYVSSKSDFSLVIPIVSDEHTGEYSCTSSTIDIQYFLILCPTNTHKEKVANESGTISVECSLDQNRSVSIRWERRDLSGEDELIYDSRDEAVAIPVDLRDRLTLSDDASVLTISDLKVMDGGEYWCVVLTSHGFLEGDEDYNYDYEDEEEDTDDYSLYPQKCLSQQVTRLTITGNQPVTPPSQQVTRLIIRDNQPVTPPLLDSSSTDTTEPPSDSTAVFAAVGVVVGLVVIGAIIAGILVKRRRNASAKQRQSAPHSGHLRTEVELERDPGCTERLNSQDA